MLKSALKSSKKVLSQQRNIHSPVIVSAVRTPVCSAPNGKLSSLTAPKLGAIAIRAAVEKTGLTKTEIQEVIMGCVLQANQGQAPARQAAIHAGLSQNTIATTINKMCASGLKSVMYASQAIMLGHQTTIVAGGMESMSNAPHYLPNLRSGIKIGDGQIIDAIFKDGLKDAYETDKFMGHCAEDTAKKFGFTREDQDNYAIQSYKRAIEANKAGYSKNEIVTVTLQEKTGPVQITEDDEPKNFKPEKMPTLKPAFIKDGTVTAANASKVSDGASALVITSEEKASRAGMKPIARIIGFADAERAPIEFTIAPADAIPKALKMAGLTLKDVDYFEINEAFSGVALANTKLLDLDPSRLNIFGGAVALGHPIGASGARIITTLINILKVKNARIGVAAICNGGGGASAIVIENLN